MAIFISFFGLLLHWLKRWGRKQTQDSFIEYLKVNPKNTFLSIVSLIGSISVVVSSGIEFNDAQTIGTLIMTGYTVDSLVNKGSE